MERGYNADEDIWNIFNARVASEKSDGRFYGINTVKKIIREMLYAKQLHDVDFETDDKTIHKEDILSIVDKDSINSKSGFEQLGEFVGMESIQERVREVVAQIEAAVSNNSLDTPCIHMRFVGSPGTGKTTVARIIGTILKEKGILRNGSFLNIPAVISVGDLLVKQHRKLLRYAEMLTALCFSLTKHIPCIGMRD